MTFQKHLPCELCDTPVSIRNTIKNGEFRGKKACIACKILHDAVRKKPTRPNEKRKRERAGLPEFFALAIEELRLQPICQNCRGRININYEPVRNIAHILPKQRYKSVMTHPDNKLFLCAGKDGQSSCHERFDSGVSAMTEMPCFALAAENFKKFQDKVTERGKLFLIFAENC
mgnify:CR=1 FL=1